MCFLCTVYVRMQCSVLLYGAPPPPPQCSYCSRHRLSGRRSYLHPQFTAQLVGACSYWHLGTEHVFLWPCAYYYYFLRLKFLTTKFLTGDAVCRPHPQSPGTASACEGLIEPGSCDRVPRNSGVEAARDFCRMSRGNDNRHLVLRCAKKIIKGCVDLSI